VTLADEFDALIAELEAAGVDYALVGALAVAVWGAPRATTDIGLLVRAEDVPGALAAARKRGFVYEALPMHFSDGVEVRRVTKIEGGENLTLDLLLVNPQREPVWSSRSALPTEKGPVRVVSRDMLIRMKVAANRPQDLADVQRLQEADR
jgi:hypothetical protein